MPNIRIATEEDKRDLFTWRNDNLTRQMSHRNSIIDWDEHSRWFAASLANQNRLLLICEDESRGKKIAVVGFFVEGNAAVISINLSPVMRGKGEAKGCLKDSISFFRVTFPEIERITAEINSANIASQYSFIGVGFRFIRQEADILFFEYKVYDR